MPTNHNLDRLVERFWGPPSSQSPVVVTTGDLPAGHALVEEYAVVPSIRRARFLVPLRAPRAVWSAFTSHLTTVSPSSRLSGVALAVGFRTKAAHPVTDRLRVGVDRRVPSADRRHQLILRQLAHDLDAPDLVAVHPVRRATPNAKPTARLFSAEGEALGYAKLGWSPPTARLVRNEAAVLHELDGEVAGLSVPRPRASGSWEGATSSLDYLVTSALPPGLRTWRTTPEDAPGILTGIADTGDRHYGRLVDSAYGASLRQRLSGAASKEPEATNALQAWLSSLEGRDDPLVFGRWHGDWVPWNLARTSRRAGGAVWDWEYSARQAPVGFDLLHWHFQTALADPEANLDTAAAALADRLSGLRLLDVSPGSHRYVADLYLLEMLTRAAGLAAEGSGWNPKLFPRLVPFAARAAGGSAA